jgi:membrane-bound lytic murein transglycosylase D
VHTKIKNSLTAPVIELHPAIEDYVANYIRKNSDMLDEINRARGSHFKTIDKVFTKQNIPVELKYLAVIESQLKTTALSRVGAKGMWQLMPETARILGLKVNGKVDERTYAYKSTVAAARYLQDLYKIFDDWLLTIAAYNSGPGPVFNAIKKSGSRNFYKLQNFLPQETRLHVKKFIATHYYFEGCGSIVTLTKMEREQHLDAVAKFVKMQATQSLPITPQEEDEYVNWVAVMNQDNNVTVVLKK